MFGRVGRSAAEGRRAGGALIVRGSEAKCVAWPGWTGRPAGPHSRRRSDPVTRSHAPARVPHRHGDLGLGPAGSDRSTISGRHKRSDGHQRGPRGTSGRGVGLRQATPHSEVPRGLIPHAATNLLTRSFRWLRASMAARTPRDSTGPASGVVARRPAPSSTFKSTTNYWP